MDSKFFTPAFFVSADKLTELADSLPESERTFTTMLSVAASKPEMLPHLLVVVGAVLSANLPL